MQTRPYSLTLDASGNGVLLVRNHKGGIRMRIRQVAATMSAVGSGVATISKNGAFLASTPIGPRITANGDIPLFCSEYIEIQFVNGPINATVSVTLSYEEESDRD